MVQFDTPRRPARATETDPRSTGLLVIALVLALLVLSLFVTRKLQAAAILEDCLLAGHTHCYDRVPCAAKLKVTLPWEAGISP
jgi:hypothetical protein